MTITGIVVKNIIRKLLAGEDYRIEVVALLDAQFLQYVIDFFGRVVDAKLKNQSVTIDWYKAEFLNPEHPEFNPSDIAIHSGLNKKTITNMYKSGAKAVVLEASMEHYDVLLNAIQELTEQSDVDVTLTIKFRAVSVDLDINESLIVINTLAVKRAALRGGLWSTAGKQVEKPLMTTLCALYRVPLKYFNQSVPSASTGQVIREADFYLEGDTGLSHRCEVKLMGKGNPESVDAPIARGSKVFVADTLSDQNKAQLNEAGIHWVELRDENGYKRFEQVLTALSIPCQPFEDDVQGALDKIFPVILSDDVQSSVTPDVILREQSGDDSQLLVDFD